MQQDIPLRCPRCGHKWTVLCPVDDAGVTRLEDDICPKCGTQGEIPDVPD